MGANFTPTLDGYSGQGAFRFWCQKVLPLVYDDSLSYMELLSKVVAYLNNTISDVANVEENVGKLNNAYVQLQDYVNDYFENLDITNEIENKLDKMASDGTLDSIVAPLIPAQVTAWLNENVNPVGSAVVVDKTLTINGAAADAKVTGDTINELIPMSPMNIKGFNGNNLIQFAEVISGKYPYVQSNKVAFGSNAAYTTYIIKYVKPNTYLLPSTQWYVVTDKDGTVTTSPSSAITTLTITNENSIVYLGFSQSSPYFTSGDISNDWTIDNLSIASSLYDSSITIPNFKWITTKRIPIYYNNSWFYKDLLPVLANNDYYYQQKFDNRIELWRPTSGIVNNRYSLYSPLNYELVDSGIFRIEYKEPTAIDKTILVIGDSTIASGYEVKGIIDNYQGNITLLGTKSAQGVNFEAVSGATTNSYANSQTIAGTINPFYNNGFNFAYYMTNNGYTHVDDVIIQLGINDFAGGVEPSNYEAIYSLFRANIQKIVDSIKAYDPNINVFFNLIFGPKLTPSGYSPIWNWPWNVRYCFIHTNHKLITNPISGLILVPTNIIFDQATMMQDTVHPNTNGYALLGEFLADFISANY